MAQIGLLILMGIVVNNGIVLLDHLNQLRREGMPREQAILQAGPQILSLPVDAGAREHAGAFAGFLERGGWIAWGAVPTDRPLGDGADILWRRLMGEWDVLIDGGCDPLLLLQQGMVTPACGLAGLDPPQADRVLELAGHVAHRIEAEALDAGLNVGA